jgi:hypothetical protein
MTNILAKDVNQEKSYKKLVVSVYAKMDLCQLIPFVLDVKIQIAKNV